MSTHASLCSDSSSCTSGHPARSAAALRSSITPSATGLIGGGGRQRPTSGRDRERVGRKGTIHCQRFIYRWALYRMCKHTEAQTLFEAQTPWRFTNACVCGFPSLSILSSSWRHLIILQYTRTRPPPVPAAQSLLLHSEQKFTQSRRRYLNTPLTHHTRDAYTCHTLTARPHGATRMSAALPSLSHRSPPPLSRVSLPRFAPLPHPLSKTHVTSPNCSQSNERTSTPESCMSTQNFL